MSTYNKKLIFYWSRFKIKLISVNLGLFLPFLLCGAFEIVVHVLQPFESFKSDKRYLSAATLLNFVLNYFFVVWFQLGTLVKGYDTFAERKSFKSIDDKNSNRANLIDKHQELERPGIDDTIRASEISIKKEKKPSKKILLAVSDSDLHESSNLSNSQSRGSTMNFDGNINASEQAASIIEVDK